MMEQFGSGSGHGPLFMCAKLTLWVESLKKCQLLRTKPLRAPSIPMNGKEMPHACGEDHKPRRQIQQKEGERRMSAPAGPDGRRDDRLTELVGQYQTSLRRMCYAMLRDEELAKDAVQETFLKAYRAMDAFRGECSEKTWLMRIAVNTCRDIGRSSWFRHTDRRIRA